MDGRLPTSTTFVVSGIVRARWFLETVGNEFAGPAPGGPVLR